MVLHGFHGQRAHINTYIWCAVGAAIGWVLGSLLTKGTKTELIESMLVGVFGAFIGGEFVAAQIHGTRPGVPAFAMSLGLSVGCACAMLALLGLMRRVVGPMKAGKSKSRDRG